MALPFQERLASVARAVVCRVPLKWNLLSAASRGDAGLVRFLLRTGVNPSSRNRKGESALFLASREGHEIIVRLLVEAGAKADERAFGPRSTKAWRPRLGATPLVIAAAKGHETVVESLVTSGADPNRRGYLSYIGEGRDVSPLTAAILGSSLGAMRSLLEAGANPKEPEALFAAVESGCARFVKVLVDHGADPDEIGHDEEYSSTGPPGFNLSWVKRGGFDTALIRAAKRGHEDVVRTMLDSKRDSIDPSAVLCAAVILGDLDEIGRLLASGIDIDAEAPDRRTALCSAVKARRVDIVKYLLEHGADVNGRWGSYGRTALMEAVTRSKEIVRVLLNAGAEVNAQDEDGEGALYLACDLAYGDRSYDIVQLLVGAGADRVQI